MANSSLAVVKPETPKTAPNLFETKGVLHKIKDTHAKELVIGLCGPVGAPLREVARILTKTLKEKYEYNPSVIKLSSFIEQLKGPVVETPDKYDRYSYLIQKGNDLRQQHGNAVLAELAVKEISLRRAQELESQGSAEPIPLRFCHIVDSLKNTDELELFRLVYGNLFVLIGVHSSPAERAQNLQSANVSQKNLSQLMDRDSGEDIAHGQEVRKAFPKSDFFLNATKCNSTTIEKKLGRILELVTRSRIITPTTEETAMYHAYTASLNSGCLSRQVGAVVTNSEGKVLGIGWNDVPRFGGGLYGEDGKTDHRCMHKEGGKCFNDWEKDLLATEIANEVSKIGLGLESKTEEIKKRIKSASRIKDLIEFSRAVHAEMMAIISAGQMSGPDTMRGGKIFVTTYPCHACARHIVAAGLSEVIYVEPYRKSMAIKLHPDSLTEETESSEKVVIKPFEGVGPSRYPDFFELNAARKASGKMVSVNPKDAVFSSATSLKPYTALEGLIVGDLQKRGLVASEPTSQSAS